MPSLYSPTHLQNLCRKYDLNPSKKYGQNFLINPEPVEKMVEVGEVSSDDVVVEVGPGFGVLTEQLAQHAKKVFSFEIEKKLEPYWQEKTKKTPNVEIIWGNVVKEFSIFNSQFSKNEKYKVLANLPYQITSQAIRLFLEQKNPPTTMIFMVQKEVAERICAKPGDMSLLSVAVQYYAKSEYVLTVPRSCYWPEPRVDSAVIKLTLKKQEQNVLNNEFFFKVVKAGFSSRRKFLSKNLKPLFPKKQNELAKSIFQKIGLLPTARAQELSIETWATLVKELSFFIPS